MNIERALTIDGWMTERELNWLALQASEHRRIVEVGSWMGRSTRALADNMHEEAALFAVDSWCGEGFDGYAAALADKPKDWLFDKFVKNMEGCRVTPVRLSSLDAARGAAALSQCFDMVFIDADHSYEGVKADILAWKTLLTPGGLLCGHDYGRPCFGVTRAVDELIEPVDTENSIWYKRVL